MQNPFKEELKYTPFDRITPDNIREAIVQGIREAEAEIEAIAGNPAPPTFANTILAIEESGAMLERASTAMYNLLSACTSDELQALSQEMAPLLAEHSNNIAMNARLFQRVRQVKEQAEAGQLPELSEEDLRMTDGTFEGFERSGACLPDDKKARFREISMQMSQLSLQFSDNNLKATNDYQLHITDESKLSGLPDTLRKQAAATAKERGLDGWVFTLQSPSYGPFMTYAHDRELRQQMYYASILRCTEHSPYDNTETVRQLINLRQETAQLLGYPCYADYVLSRRMAGSTQAVYDLLHQLIGSYRPAALADVEAIRRQARKMEGDDFELKPWDFGYYNHKLQLEKYNLDSEMFRPYLPLQQVIDGVFGLATRLYGLTFRPNTECPLYHPDVQAFDVLEADGTPLALLYADFFPRESKQGGAWMTSYRDQWTDDQGQRRLPHVSIVMNFTKPTPDAPALLTLGEVGTLLHEFGHALHGMFSNVRRRNMGGTNVYWDFVELPSQFMENYLLEPEFLRTFARHYQTGEPLPQELIDRMDRARHYNVGYSCLRQVSFGLLDMAYYSLTSPLQGDLRQFETEACAEADVMEHAPEACTSVQFGHIMSGGYAAGYYSYKWAEVLDADAFAAFKEEGIFNKDTAARFRREILARGNTREPMALYEAFRGRKPSIEALLQRDGIRK